MRYHIYFNRKMKLQSSRQFSWPIFILEFNGKETLLLKLMQVYVYFGIWLLLCLAILHYLCCYHKSLPSFNIPWWFFCLSTNITSSPINSHRISLPCQRLRHQVKVQLLQIHLCIKTIVFLLCSCLPQLCEIR